MNIINDNLNILNIINDNSLDEINKIEKTNDIINKNDEKNNLINGYDETYLNNKIYIKKIKNLSNIKYGIDENGNPINIYEYYKNMNVKKKKPRLIAYIASEKNKNELIDLNGNKIMKKNKEGDYEFPFKLNILIKDFDVQHPELRINGERAYNNNQDSKENNININNIEKDNKIPRPIKSIHGNNNMNDRNILKKRLLREKSDFNGVKIMKRMKSRYDNLNDNISYFNNKNNSFKKDKIINKRNNKYPSLNITNSINVTTSNIRDKQEIISRTNSILNMSKSNDNKYSIYGISQRVNSQKINHCNTNRCKDNKKIIPTKHNYTNRNNSFITPKIITNHISNKDVDIDTNKIIDYKINLNSGSSLSFKINDINKENNKSSYNSILSDDSKIIKIKNDSFTNNTSVDIKRNKTKCKNDEKLIYNDVNNTINNFININNSKYNNKKTINKKKKEQIEKCNKKYFDFIINKIKLNNYFKSHRQQNTIQEKENKNKNKKINHNLYLNHLKTSSIRTSQSSSKKSFKACNNDNNKNKNFISNINMNIIKKSKLISRIIPQKSQKRLKCSVLTNEANDMIKNFWVNKKVSKSRNLLINKNILVNHPSLTRYISSPVITLGNKSYE